VSAKVAPTANASCINADAGLLAAVEQGATTHFHRITHLEVRLDSKSGILE
jgi:hypothetical protein